MKRFSFSLQKLLDYKEQMLETERIVLADMHAILAGLTAEREKMLGQREERRQLLQQLSAEGISAMEMETHKNYLTALDFTIQQKERQIALQRQAIARQMEKLREAKQEVSTIEKLKERKREEYDHLAQKEEERLIEEFVIASRAMANG